MRNHTSATVAALTLALLTAGCSAGTAPTPYLDPHGEPVTQAPYDVPTTPSQTGADTDVSDETPSQSPTPVDVIETHADPAAYGLTVGDEQAASQAAIEFLQAAWAWNSTDTSDRAGLQRALPLATPELATHLQTFIDQPVFTPEEWATVAGQIDVGSLIEVIAAMPVEDAAYDASTYTVRLIYNTYILDAGGAPLPRAEDARYATLVLTRTETGSWLVSALPYQDVEQVIETSSTQLP